MAFGATPVLWAAWGFAPSGTPPAVPHLQETAMLQPSPQTAPLDAGSVRAVDAVIVGAGFAGMVMLHRLRGLGLSAIVFEAGGGVGGTWYWNRYPGARCDVESMEYSYPFSSALQQEWEWSERYAAQPEILRYAEHVAERFDLRRDMRFNTRVTAAAFDAMTGALDKIAVRGIGGRTLKDKWSAGPRTYLGLATAGFPNLFIITGPGSPSVLTNMLPSIEQHVDWIADCLAALRRRGVGRIEATEAAAAAWVARVNAIAAATLFPTCNSWYLGANIPGKPRVFMPHLGMPAYVKTCEEVAAAGYAGFTLTPGG